MEDFSFTNIVKSILNEDINEAGEDFGASVKGNLTIEAKIQTHYL